MTASRPPFRADHVGSLLRPPALKERVSMDQLCVSPQCGFSSTVEGNAITAEAQRAKLALCVDLARDVWGGL